MGEAYFSLHICCKYRTHLGESTSQELFEREKNMQNIVLKDWMTSR